MCGGSTMFARSEVKKHASRESCWIIIERKIYDVTAFLDEHPGGDSVILRYAGKDATDAFVPVHPAGTLEKYMQPDQVIGLLSDKEEKVQDPGLSEKTISKQSRRPKLSSIISLDDFEIAASKILSPRHFAFFATGAEDEQAIKWNRDSWKAVRFRPRMLRPIERVDLSTTILGTDFSAPFFICPAGGGKLAHPDGEVGLTRAAGKHEILQWVCNNAGCTKEQMAGAKTPSQSLFWQIYVKANLAESEKEVKEAVALGYKAFALTVDAIRPGKRERDIRVSMAEEDEDLDDDEEEAEVETASFAKAPTVKRPPVWSSFDWPAAVKWLRGLTDLPIAIKGIQCWEDAELCMKHGVHPWLSNHGGRQLDGSPSAVDTLLEIRTHCPQVFDTCEVIVDGGVRRGSDVVKALALGARSVGLGRSFLYSLVLGERGVGKAIEILKHEVETTMALLGVTSIKQIEFSHVETSGATYMHGARSRL